MKKLIEQCGDPHNYIYLKTESVPIANPSTRIIQKEIYACDDCGKGLEIYHLDTPMLIEEIPEEGGK